MVCDGTLAFYTFFITSSEDLFLSSVTRYNTNAWWTTPESKFNISIVSNSFAKMILSVENIGLMMKKMKIIPPWYTNKKQISKQANQEG
jgi:hypothetical protein